MRHRATAAIKQIPSWQREHWLLFACVLAATMLVIAIVPGFAVAMRDDWPQARESIPLELPPLSKRAARESYPRGVARAKTVY